MKSSLKSIVWKAGACMVLCQMGWSATPETKAVKTPVDGAMGFVRTLPERFLFDGNFNFRFNGMSLQIDHIAPQSKLVTKKRACMFGLSYMQPIMGKMFSSRIDMPFFGSDQIRKGWTQAAVGDYRMSFSDTKLVSSELQLFAQVRF